MYFIKNQSIKSNEKKILRKVKKNWVVLSLSVLTVVGTGSIISQRYVAHADVIESNSNSANNSSNATSQNASLGSQSDDLNILNNSDTSNNVFSNYNSYVSHSNADIQSNSSSANSSANNDNINSQVALPTTTSNSNDPSSVINDSKQLSSQSNVSNNGSNNSLLHELRITSPDNNKLVDNNVLFTHFTYRRTVLLVDYNTINSQNPSGQLISNAVDNNGNTVANEFTQSASFSRSASISNDTISYTPWSLDADSTNVPAYDTPVLKGWRLGSNNADSTDSASATIGEFDLDALNNSFSSINSIALSSASASNASGIYSFTDNNNISVPYTKDSSISKNPNIVINHITYTRVIRLVDNATVTDENKNGDLISNAVDHNGNSVATELIESAEFSRSTSEYETNNGIAFSYGPWSLAANSNNVPDYLTPTIKGWRLGAPDLNFTDSTQKTVDGFSLADINDNWNMISSAAESSAVANAASGYVNFSLGNLDNIRYTKDSASASKPNSNSTNNPSNVLNPSHGISTPYTNYSLALDTSILNNINSVSSFNSVFSSAVTSSSSSASASSAASSAATQYYEMYNYKTRLVKRNGTIYIFIQPRYTDNDTNGNLKHRDVVTITNENGKVTHDQKVTLYQYNAMLSASGKSTFTPEQLQRAYVKRHRKYGIMRDKTHKTTFISPITKQGNNVLIDTSGEQKGFYSTNNHYLVEDTDDLRVKIPKNGDQHHGSKKHNKHVK